MSDGYETPSLIASAISNGDTEAEAILLKKYYRQVLFILERKTGSKDAAEDLCQETFRIMLERLRREPLQDPEKLANFLHSIAINLHIDEIRKSDRRKTYPDSEFLDMVKDEAQDQYTSLLQEKSRDAIRNLLLSMKNERDRKLLYYYYIEEKEKKEICLELDLEHRHFDRVIFRAKQRFKDLILKDEGGYFEELPA